MKTSILVVSAALSALMGTTAAQAQSVGAAGLARAATGASFTVGDTRFRLAPSATVIAATKDTRPEHLIAGGRYAMRIDAGTGLQPRSGAPARTLAAAVSDNGMPVVVTSSVNVYFDQPAVLSDAVRLTGGKLTYASNIGGKGTLEFASVAAAIDAIGKLQGRAGVKEASPVIVQFEDQLF